MSADLKIVGEPAGDEEAVSRLLGQMSEQFSSEVPPALQTLGISAIEDAMVKERGRGGRIYGSVAAVLVAAGVMFVVSSSTPEVGGVAEVSALHGDVEVQTESGWEALVQGSVLAEGTSVRTGDRSGAEFSMKSDVTVAMQQASELSWVDAEAKRVQLAQGSASFQVEPLPKGEFFSVVAGDTTVTVHGTEFSVTLREEAAAPCVVVSEGLVEVKNPEAKIWVSAGQSTGCALPEEAAPEVAAQPEAEEKDAAPPVTRVAHRVKPAKPAEKGTTLEEQNKLFQSALVAEQQGDLSLARQRLDLFLSKYPGSPLATQVRAQRASLNRRK